MSVNRNISHLHPSSSLLSDVLGMYCFTILSMLFIKIYQMLHYIHPVLLKHLFPLLSIHLCLVFSLQIIHAYITYLKRFSEKKEKISKATKSHNTCIVSTLVNYWNSVLWDGGVSHWSSLGWAMLQTRLFSGWLFA